MKQGGSPYRAPPFLFCRNPTFLTSGFSTADWIATLPNVRHLSQLAAARRKTIGAGHRAVLGPW